MTKFRALMGLTIALLMFPLAPVRTPAAPMATEAFVRTWARTDQPVAGGVAARSWMWGPEPRTGGLREDYAEAPGGERIVQYFDKSRMEDNSWQGASPPWDVTNGLLVVELMTGQLQIGDDTFQTRQPARVNVAGDDGDPDGPTYATFAAVRDADPLPVAEGDGAVIINQAIDRDGNVTTAAQWEQYGVTTAHLDEVTNHTIARPFWDFMHAAGTIWEDDDYVDDALFPDPYYATGRPVAEAYWTAVLVGGTEKDVLIQCFERRCLTYTPSNDPAWRVEMGNVGSHYYAWRYGQQGPSALASELAADVYTAQDGELRYLALRDVMAALHVGVYSGEGEQILGGAERGAADFYLYDIELRMMAGAISRGQTWGVADLAMQLTAMGLAPEGTALDPAAARAAILRAVAASGASPDEPSSLPPLLIRELGLLQTEPYDLLEDVALERMRFDALAYFILLAGASVSAVEGDLPLDTAASDLIAQSNGVLQRSLAGNPCDPHAGFDGDAVKDAWSWTKIFGELAGLFGETVASGTAVLDGIHGAVLSYSVGVTSLDDRLETHYGHDTPGAPLQFRVKVEMRDELPEVMVRCGWIAGTEYPPAGPIAKVSVHWFWPGLGEHGDLSCGAACGQAAESGVALEATGADGIATLHFQPKTEAVPGEGWITEEYGVVTGIALYQSRFTNLLGSYAQYLTPKSGITAWSVRWHEVPGYKVTIKGQYEGTMTTTYYSARVDWAGSGSATWTLFIPADGVVYPYQTYSPYSAQGSGSFQISSSGNNCSGGSFNGAWSGDTVMHPDEARHDSGPGVVLRYVKFNMMPAPRSLYQLSGDCSPLTIDAVFATSMRQMIPIDLQERGVQTRTFGSDPACQQWFANDPDGACDVSSTWTITVEHTGEPSPIGNNGPNRSHSS